MFHEKIISRVKQPRNTNTSHLYSHFTTSSIFSRGIRTFFSFCLFLSLPLALPLSLFLFLLSDFREISRKSKRKGEREREKERERKRERDRETERERGKEKFLGSQKYVYICTARGQAKGENEFASVCEVEAHDKFSRESFAAGAAFVCRSVDLREGQGQESLCACVAACCSVLQYVAVCEGVTTGASLVCLVSTCAKGRGSSRCALVLQSVAVCCSVLQRVPVCSSVSQCVKVSPSLCACAGEERHNIVSFVGLFCKRDL